MAHKPKAIKAVAEAVASATDNLMAPAPAPMLAPGTVITVEPMFASVGEFVEASMEAYHDTLLVARWRMGEILDRFLRSFADDKKTQADGRKAIRDRNKDAAAVQSQAYGVYKYIPLQCLQQYPLLTWSKARAIAGCKQLQMMAPDYRAEWVSWATTAQMIWRDNLNQLVLPSIDDLKASLNILKIFGGLMHPQKAYDWSRKVASELPAAYTVEKAALAVQWTEAVEFGTAAAPETPATVLVSEAPATE